MPLTKRDVEIVSNEQSFIPVLYLLGSAQGFFLALALFTSKSGNKRANRYLGALTIVFALALVDYYLDFTGLRDTYIQLRTLLWPKEYLYGTLIYFYVRELTRPGQFKLKGRQWLHFLPAFLHACVAWSLLFLNPERQIAILSETTGAGLPDDLLAWLLGDFELWTVIAQLTLYLILSFRLLQEHRKDIAKNFSFTEKISLDWLRNLLVGIVIVYLVWLLDELLSEWVNLARAFDIALALSMVLLIYTMGYLGLRQPLIFSSTVKSPAGTRPGKESDQVVSSDESAGKYKNSPLSPELSQALLSELLTIMEQEAPHLDSQLSLPQLAERLGVSVNYLSQVINEQRKQNFFDFINSYRIEEAKRLLRSPERDSKNILGIALDSGFNSKSAFYNAFKKHTGMTPGQFRTDG